MEKNYSEQYFSNVSSALSNPSKLQEARMRKAMQNRIQPLQLSKIIGTTSTNKQNLQLHPISGDVFHVAGSTVVSYGIESNSQKRFIFSPNKRNIVAICFSPDGQLLATGEGSCKNPEITIWDLSAPSNPSETDKPLKQLGGHRYGLKMLFFSPNGKYLVSIGDENDKGLFVWDWLSEKRLTLNKLLKVPLSGCFSGDGTKFATCGEKHIKLWQFQPNGEIIRTPAKDKEDAFILEGKPANLGAKFTDKTFTDCAFDQQSKLLYAATSNGHVCIVEENRVVLRWIDTKLSRIFNISVNSDTIICSGTDGYIRMLRTVTLDHIVTFPKIPAILSYNIEKGETKIKPSANKGEYADVVGIVEDKQRKRVVAIYSDRSMFVWDINNLEKISIKRSFLQHSGSITDLQILNTPSSSEVTFFMTASADRTVRIWYEVSEDSSRPDAIPPTLGLRRNAYSKNLSRIIYLTKNYQSFKYKESENHYGDGSFIPLDAVESEEHATCVKSTKDGSQIVVGSSNGMLTFIDVSKFEVTSKIQAHDQEISCMDVVETNNQRLLATGSRDMRIKIFDLNSLNQNILSIDDHSASITSVKFALTQTSLYLISASSDKQIVFREQRSGQFITTHREIDKTSKINSLEISSDQLSLLVGFDKKINSYNIASGKVTKSFETKDDDSAAKSTLDNLNILTDISSSYVACFNQDKIIRIRDCNTMSVVSRAICGEQISGMGFTMNNSHLITSSSEGCIYIWKLNLELKNNIEKKKQSLGIIQKKLQDLFKQEGLNLDGSKDWNLGSYWLEEEMRQHIMKQQMQQQQELKEQQLKSEKAQKITKTKENNSQIDSVLRNVKPMDLMKDQKLPKWARSNGSGLAEVIADKDNQADKALDYYQPEKIAAEQENKEKQPYQFVQRTNNFVGDSELIFDSTNNQQQYSLYSQINPNRQFQQSNFGNDSINEREVDSNGDVVMNSKITYAIGQQIKNNNKGGNEYLENTEYEGDQQVQEEEQHPIIIDDNKLLGAEAVNFEDFEMDNNNDNDSQFLGKIDKTIPVSQTQANLYRKLIATNNQSIGGLKDKSIPIKQQINHQKDNAVQNQDELIVEDIQIEKESNNNNNHGESLTYSTNTKKDLEQMNINDQKQKDTLRNQQNEAIEYQKNNGMVSVFDPAMIQGQLDKVGLNLKQAETQFNFKGDQLDMFKSKNLNSLIDDMQLHYENNTLLQSNFMEAPLQEHEKEFFMKQDEFIVLTDEDDDKVGVVEENKDNGKGIEDKFIKNNSEKKVSTNIQNNNVAQGNQLDNKENNTQKVNPFDSKQENNGKSSSNVAKYQTASAKNDDMFIEEIILEDIEGDSRQEAQGEKLPSVNSTKISKTNNYGQNKQLTESLKKPKNATQKDLLIEGEKSQQKDQTIKDNAPISNSNINSNTNVEVQSGKKLIPVQDKEDEDQQVDEFDESYQIAKKPQYQHYQELVDNSFKVILQELSKIEDLVENTLDSEPVSLRKKVYDKINLKANKVKTSLHNIFQKQSQITTTADSTQQLNSISHNNTSYFDVDPNLLENYSKMLLEAVLKRK